MPLSTDIPSADMLIEALGLQAHVEGGFFRRTYQAEHSPRVRVDGSKERYLMTSIFYLLTASSAIGHWHCNTSDIVHYYHLGDAVDYSLIYPDGTLVSVRMGSAVINGEELQLTVPGGVWKSSRLVTGDAGYGLISEAVSPGFAYEDMTLGDSATLKSLFPQHEALIDAFSKY